MCIEILSRFLALFGFIELAFKDGSLVLGSLFGKYFRVVTFGESHGRAVGVVVDGVSPGRPISEKDIQRELDRRRPGQSRVTSPRNEADRIEILSGVFQGKTLGSPICMLVWNQDQRSGDYDALKDVFRPGHADFTYQLKYGVRDHRGGGRASARETVGRVAAGAIARKELSELGVVIRAGTVAIGPVIARERCWEEANRNPVRCPDAEAAKLMEDAILKAGAEGNSLGGLVELEIVGVPAGLGDPVFDKLDATLAHSLMSIGAVKGIEIGEGFNAANLTGLQMNDEMTSGGFLSNRSGGILGGISTGAPIVARVAVKPTPSIRLPQKSIDRIGQDRTVVISGRHDPCICPRIVPVVESMAAIVLYDAWLANERLQNDGNSLDKLRNEVDRIDAEILDLLRLREEVSVDIGEVKTEIGMSVLDNGREEAMKATRGAHADRLGLDRQFVESLFERIIERSREVQSR
ncbi:MAG: chorismate synthase [Deltaproteobacteria bacterium]|nr:chorismate synthase [Deltaproteobacteria bacterium]